MARGSPTKPDSAASCAARHSLWWLLFGNLVGLYLSLLILFPELQLAQWTYGRWVPVHLNVQLYGWTSLPLVTWLFVLFEVDRGRLQSWAKAATWAWTAALGLGALHWLGGISSGKIFLDWRGGSLWALVASQLILWAVLAVAWRQNAPGWTKLRRYSTLAGLIVLALVPWVLIMASSPALYPPIDRTTGGPTGSSLQGSALVVIGLMLLLPRVAAKARDTRKSWGIWVFFLISWIIFGVAEAMGGTHYDAHQIGSMLVLLPWVWWLPRDWSGFIWPEGSRIWRGAMFAWWGVLVVTALFMYQAGVLDRIKFTQALVGHSHLAMAGFTSSFCALLLVLLTGRRIGSNLSVSLWHAATIIMIITLAAVGWAEGHDPSWMLARENWREWGFIIRALCGLVMAWASLNWWMERRKIYLKSAPVVNSSPWSFGVVEK